jgi:sec-independent protein translocase protein TatA
MMGDVAKGLKSFKKGMAEDDEIPAAPRRIEGDRTVDAAPAERSRSADPVERREP